MFKKGYEGDCVKYPKYIYPRKVDVILIANECMDVIKNSRAKGVVCKFDVEKAYDRVD